MTGPGGAVLGLVMVAALALVAGGGWLVATGRNRTQGWLMLMLAAVCVANVAIWAA